MPFRACLRRVLRGRDELNSPSQVDKREGKSYPDNVYRPGEAMPRPKYRGPWNQAHQDKLSAFSFDRAWTNGRGKRGDGDVAGKSSVGAGAGEYSPMGSKMPSRANSRKESTWSGFNFGTKRSQFSRRSGERWGDGFERTMQNEANISTGKAGGTMYGERRIETTEMESGNKDHVREDAARPTELDGGEESHIAHGKT